MTHYLNPALETLLELDGSVLEQENGFWIKVEVRSVEASEHVPHGIRYSLTLHDKYGMRVLGYDNAHAVKPPKKFKFSGRRLPYDHRHRASSDTGVPYLFESPQRLLEDFFAEVDQVIKEARK